MPASALPTPRKAAVNQADIDAIACDLFAQRGFARTSMRDIAEALGIRAPSLYNHIKSKEEVLNRILLATIRDQYSDLIQALSPGKTAADKVRSGIAAQVRFRSQRASAIVVAARETLELDPDIKAEFLSLRDRQYGLWSDVIELGVQEGSFHVPSTRLASITLYDLFNYIEINLLLLQEERAVAELSDWYIALALQSLGVRPADRA